MTAEHERRRQLAFNTIRNTSGIVDVVHVNQQNAKDMSTSDLTVKADLRNDTATAQHATLSTTITHGATHVGSMEQVRDAVKESAGPVRS